MNDPIPLLGTPHIHFFALLIIGGLAGWIAGMVAGARHGIFTNILIGIAGSWLGSKVAELLQIGVVGSAMQLAMAVAGSVVIILLWRMLHGSGSPAARN